MKKYLISIQPNSVAMINLNKIIWCSGKAFSLQRGEERKVIVSHNLTQSLLN